MRTRSTGITAIFDGLRGMRGEISQRAIEFERLRRIPPDLAERLKATGAFRLNVPERVGGAEADICEKLEILEDLAAADASVAWTVAVGMQSHCYLGHLRPETFAALYAAHPDLVLAGGAAPTGTAEPCPGGYRVNGKWAWASGCLHADWLFALCAVLKDGAVQPGPVAGRPLTCMAIIPANSATFHDDTSWFVAGLKGTGSCDFSVRDLMVPVEHIYDQISWTPNGPEAVLLPAITTAPLDFAAVATGIARGAVDDVVALARSGKQRLYSAARSAEQPVFQYRLGEAETRMRAAHALVWAQARQIFDSAREIPRGPPFLTHPLVKATQASAWVAVRLAAEAVDTCADIAGGSSVHETSPLQRRRRDIHTLSQHVGFGDPIMTRHGAGLVGVEVTL